MPVQRLATCGADEELFPHFYSKENPLCTTYTSYCNLTEVPEPSCKGWRDELQSIFLHEFMDMGSFLEAILET